MPKKRTILVTGVSGYWGSRLAARLMAEADQCRENGGGPAASYHVLGLDSEPPEREIKDLDFIQADIRNPLLVDLLESEEVDTICHLVFHDSGRSSETTFDLNVMGAMKVLGACAEAGVRKVILKSSTSVYGALPTNPAFLTEEHPLSSRKTGFTRELIEIESFVNGFRHQVPDMIVTTLRFPSIIGLDVETPMTRFLCDPLAPVLLGFDPLMQVIHERDAIDALVHAVAVDAPGVFNVAAEGVLPLTRLMGLAGKLPVPVFHLFAYWASGGPKVSRYLPIELDYIRYPWVSDLAKMQNELGFTPRYTSEEALREFAGQQRLRRYLPESAALAYDEERLRDTIERRRRIRDRSDLQYTDQVEAENE
jgi:UDP-glucose 4-epimerase